MRNVGFRMYFKSEIGWHLGQKVPLHNILRLYPHIKLLIDVSIRVVKKRFQLIIGTNPLELTLDYVGDKLQCWKMAALGWLNLDFGLKNIYGFLVIIKLFCGIYSVFKHGCWSQVAVSDQKHLQVGPAKKVITQLVPLHVLSYDRLVYFFNLYVVLLQSRVNGCHWDLRTLFGSAGGGLSKRGFYVQNVQIDRVITHRVL